MALRPGEKPVTRHQYLSNKIKVKDTLKFEKFLFFLLFVSAPKVNQKGNVCLFPKESKTLNGF